MEANNDFYSTFSMRPISVQSPGKPKNQQIQVLSPMVATHSPAITPPMSRTGKSPRNKQLPPLSQTDSALVPYAAEPDFSAKSNVLAIVPVSREDRLLAAEQRQSVLQSELMIMHKTLKQEEDCCRKASEDHQVCVQLLTELRSEKEQLSEACSSTLAESESIKANLHLAESQQRRWYGNFEEMAALHSQEAKDVVVRQFDKRWQIFTPENVEVQQTYSLMAELQDVCKANKHLRNEAIFKDLYKRQDELEAIIAQQEGELSKLRKAQKLAHQKAGKSAMAMLASQDSGLARAVFGLWRDDWQAERKARWDREAEQLNKAMEKMNARSKKMVGGAGASLVSSQTEVLTRTVFEVWKNEWKTASSARWAERSRHATNAKVDLLKDRFKVIARQVATRWIVSDSTNLVGLVFGEWRTAVPKVKQKKPGLWQRVKSKIGLIK